MVKIEKIRNGAQADEIRAKINDNFEKISKNISSTNLSLSTEERLSISNEYLKDGLIVFDSSLDKWFKRVGNSWVLYEFSPVYKRKFSASEWGENNILNIPYTMHGINITNVCVYMLYQNKYISCVTDVEISDNNDVGIHSDLAFDGEVVIS